MSRPRRRSLRAAVAASCAVLVLAGCADDSADDGGDSAQASPEITQTPTPGDAEQITAVAVELATTDDLVRKCEQLATPGFVLAVFGSQENCRTSDDAADGDSEATGADVSSVMVTGDSATAVITLRGGDTDGAGGSWRFSKDAGGWRLAEWSIDYLRSVLATGFGANYEAEDADDPFAEEEIRSCFTAKLQSLDDQSFRTVVYSLVANRDDSNEVLGRALIECGYIADDSDLAAADTEVRAAFEASYRASGSQVRPEADINCELGQLRESVSDEEIQAAETGNSDAYATIGAAAAEAQDDCLQSQT
jgi:hypothetical protein